MILGASFLSTTAVAAPPTATVRKTKSVSVPARPEPFDLDVSKTAVLVIDMQNDFGAKGGMFDRAGVDIGGIRAVIPAVQSALAASRSAGLPIVYLKMAFRPDLSDAGPPGGPNLIKHGPLHVGASITAPNGRPSRILVRDTWNTDVIPELEPEPNDIVLYKTRFSGFYNTDLHERLRSRGIDTLIVTGCTTSVCVESTVRDAMFRDYRCLLLEDCMAEPVGSKEVRTNHQASLLAMQILFAWVSDSQKLASTIS